jgi:hypothetical protein
VRQGSTDLFVTAQYGDDFLGESARALVVVR